MKRELGIIIIGDSGSGKSTIALLLEEFLKKKGLKKKIMKKYV
jgi:adenylylsulfate kinase-like enzyme